ncbi:APC family permease [Streptomyces montanus]|uniref:APC family permease n=1 Tax=Streptomyces montanus TaxID=2580423 RepID=A0A5R9FUV4_9ACTN|nr:APC family permease [Streptomyces montanus]TLS44284.1 APC family permease [Streptomyces montanus]
MSQQSHDPGHRTHLRRGAVGVAGILFFVLSAQAPLTGIVGTLPVPLGLGNGGGAPAAYLVVGAVVAVFAVGFITMSRHVTDAGAFYAYVSRGLGRTVGVGASQTALLCYGATQAGMYGLYGVVVKGLFQQYLSLDLPWWVWAVGTMIVVQILGSLNIELGAKLLAVLVVAESSLLVAFAFHEFVTGGGPQGLDFAGSFAPSAFFAGAPGVALTFAIASMIGFESAAIYSQEAKDPARTVPRATYLSVVVISVFFSFVSWMVVSHYGADNVGGAARTALQNGEATSVVLAAVTDSLGPWATDTMAVLLVSSLLAGILAFHNAINRYLHSLGTTGVLPAWLSHTNRHGAPHTASLTQTVLAFCMVVPFALAGADPVVTLLTWGGGVAVLSLLVLYILTSLSIVVFFRRTRLDTRPWHTLIAPSASVLLLLGVMIMAIANFPTLISASGDTALLLELCVLLVFVAGVFLGIVQRSQGAGSSPAHAQAAVQTDEVSSSL